MKTSYSGLQKAIQSAGGVAPLARFLKVPDKIIQNWLAADGTEVPANVRQTNAYLVEVIQKAGSQAALARELGVTYQNIVLWMKQGWVPSGRAQQIENTYGVPRAQLISPKLRSTMGIGGEL